MKKMHVLAIVAIIAMCLSSCGGASGEAVKSNEITDALDKGLVITQTSSTENSFKALIQPESGYDELYVAEATMTSEQYEELNQMDMSSDDYNEKIRNFIGTLSDAKLIDITDQIPDEHAFDELKGKTVGDLEASGYENTGYVQDEGVWNFYYDGPKYCLELTVEGDAASVDDLSPNDMRAFIIRDVKFKGFSGMLIDNI